MTRREFGGIAGGLLGALAFGGACGADGAAQRNRVLARPRPGGTTSLRGTSRLGLERDRDASVRVPADVPDSPLPLLVLLHGAGGSGEGILRRLGDVAAEAGIVVLAPDSRRGTWDAIRDDFGPDVDFLQRALDKVFSEVAVDPERVAIGGFSDGATYALSLGLANGDLFRRIVAFSPGFYVGGTVRGRPGIFVTHGTADRVLPIDRCSRVIVPALQKAGYDVTFRQFDGGHEIPPNLAREGMRFASAG